MTEAKTKQLVELEAELAAALRVPLTRAVESGADLFSFGRWNPNVAMVEEYVVLAGRCARLRDELFLDESQSVSSAYLKAHAEATDVGNENRRGPKRLAQAVLSEIHRLHPMEAASSE